MLDRLFTPPSTLPSNANATTSDEGSPSTVPNNETAPATENDGRTAQIQSGPVVTVPAEIHSEPVKPAAPELPERTDENRNLRHRDIDVESDFGVESAGGAASYYESKDNYYFLGEMATGWYGTGAESLGLEGPVKKDVFTAVLEGKLPDGADLTHMVDGVNKHRPGYDLTFSAPKSASVLALVAGDTFLIEAFNKSIDITLNEVEKLASTRTMKEGVTEFEQTGNLVVAKFLHDTSRNLDPNLHGHAVVANATLSKDGWKTLSTDTKTGRGFTDIVWHQQVSIGAFQRGVYRGLLEEAGYPIVDTGPRGQWDVEGVPITEFSSRRQEIMAA
ncbi:hypothetical protein PSTG_18130, partial [Puccinia striiformis f. sp. tritici PST-78]